MNSASSRNAILGLVEGSGSKARTTWCVGNLSTDPLDIRGTMARFRPKIENERVAGNEVGQAILHRLLADGILTAEARFYFLDPKNVDKHLGISWLDLQKGQTSEKLIQYLRSIR